jgi:hypothetical protein
MGDMRNGDRILARIPERKRPLRRLSHSWRRILKWILVKHWLRIWNSGGLF